MRTKTHAAVAGLITAAIALSVPLNAAPLTKVRIGVFSNTCEAPTYAAYEKGFFKKEGLDVELVNGNNKIFKDLLATGKLDATVGLLAQWIKPAEVGLNVKFTAGIHTGCIHVIVPKSSGIKTVKDLKGKRIAVPSIGSGPMLFTARVLADKGIKDPYGAADWKIYPQSEHQLVLTKHQVDAAAVADPIATVLIDTGKYREIINNSTFKPYSQEYCCLLVMRGSLVKSNPKTAAAITRAYLNSAKWVNSHKNEIAKIMVNKKYVAGTVGENQRALSKLNYWPSISGGKKAVLATALSMKKAGLLGSATDPKSLSRYLFVPLKGVKEVGPAPRQQTKNKIGRFDRADLVASLSSDQIGDCCTNK
jgi:NitT/TauT family transport system substrate-binding protein